MIFNSIKSMLCYALCYSRTMPSDRTIIVKNFQKPFRVIIPVREEEGSRQELGDRYRTIWYTDGSKTENSTRAKIIRCRPEDAFSINLMDCHVFVFKAEVTAMLGCAEEMKRRAYTNH